MSPPLTLTFNKPPAPTPTLIVTKLVKPLGLRNLPLSQSLLTANETPSVIPIDGS